MKILQKLLFLSLTLTLLTHTALAQTGQQNPNSTGTTLTAEQNIIDDLKAAALKGKKSPTKVPMDIAKTIISSKMKKAIGDYIMKFHICDLFDQWGAGKRVGATGTLTITFTLVPSGGPAPATPTTIVVEFFAKKNGQTTPTSGRSGAQGYVAPIIPGKGASMKYDVFGDGSYVLERLDCPD